MPTLTRRRYPERPDCWHVYYGDVHAGTIARRVGNRSAENRHVERVFDTSRNEKHWGRRKLKRDE